MPLRIALNCHGFLAARAAIRRHDDDRVGANVVSGCDEPPRREMSFADRRLVHAKVWDRQHQRRPIIEVIAMRRIIAASLALPFFVLAACGPAPQRVWPIWTGGGIYDSPDSYRGASR